MPDGGQAFGSALCRLEAPTLRSSSLFALEIGQAARPISTGQLRGSVSCRFHTRPINLVVYEGSLGALRPGTPHLGAGFPLRCFQRLSVPDMATRLYPWQDNRITRGPSTLVLSY
jgi:hypothetical protein